MSKGIVAMSGGVDSSVTALLLKNVGDELIGINMKMYDNEDIGIKDKTCCSLDDANDARSVAARLGIPFYVLNCREDFAKTVIKNFIETYETGGTPNPCIICNKKLKFGKLLEKAKELGCDYVATGHYAKIEYNEENGRYILKKSVDEKKDQSYVLYNLTQEQLAHIKLPLGEFSKDKIREIAEENNFINAKKHDSQDICFVPNGDYAEFIEGYADKKFPCGKFIYKDGTVLGEHKGIIRYTVGQRKGLGLALKAPAYVLEKDIKNNSVILGANEDLFKNEVTVKSFNWLSIAEPASPIKCKARIRYNQKEQPATAQVIGKDTVIITFDEAQRAVSPGQSAVLYNGDTVLGGGIIEK